MAGNDEKKREEEIQRLRREIETKIESARKELEDARNKCPNDISWNDTRDELFRIMDRLQEVKKGVPNEVPSLKRSPWMSKE